MISNSSLSHFLLLLLFISLICKGVCVCVCMFEYTVALFILNKLFSVRTIRIRKIFYLIFSLMLFLTSCRSKFWPILFFFSKKLLEVFLAGQIAWQHIASIFVFCGSFFFFFFLFHFWNKFFWVENSMLVFFPLNPSNTSLQLSGFVFVFVFLHDF